MNKSNGGAKERVCVREEEYAARWDRRRAALTVTAAAGCRCRSATRPGLDERRRVPRASITLPARIPPPSRSALGRLRGKATEPSGERREGGKEQRKNSQ